MSDTRIASTDEGTDAAVVIAPPRTSTAEAVLRVVVPIAMLVLAVVIWQVYVVVSGTPYLAGSNQGLEVGLATLLGVTDLSLTEAIATVTRNPARLLGHSEPALAPGEPANLVRFRLPGRLFVLTGTWVDGVAREPGAEPGRPGPEP